MGWECKNEQILIPVQDENEKVLKFVLDFDFYAAWEWKNKWLKLDFDSYAAWEWKNVQILILVQDGNEKMWKLGLDFDLESKFMCPKWSRVHRI